MDIQTFEAFSMKDAVKSVKKALGPDAVILGTKQKPAPGGKGLLYEVTAASAAKARALQGGSQKTPHPATGAHVETMLEGLSVRLTAMQDQMAARRQLATLEGGLSELKLLLLENLRTKDGSALKDLPPALVPIQRQLTVMGIDDGAVAELVRHLRELPPPDGASVESIYDYYRDDAIRWMMKRIRIAPRWAFTPGSPAVHVVVGAHGCGKSSVVAKLAAHYHAREKKQIAVISYDVSRLAAGEQMRVTCKVIGVPFSAVADAEELAEAISGYDQHDLVLVDTGGRASKQAGATADLERLKDLGVAASFHLCLPVTEKEAQLDMAVRAFAPVGLSSLAFTRLDESLGFGEIFNLSRKWGLPLSFFSIGQQIPEDLERATRERVVERIFGL